jgi:hypothetical protein
LWNTKSPLNTAVNTTNNCTSVTPVTVNKHKAWKHHYAASKSLTNFTRNTAQNFVAYGRINLEFNSKPYQAIIYFFIKHSSCSFTITSILGFWRMSPLTATQFVHNPNVFSYELYFQKHEECRLVTTLRFHRYNTM